MQNAVSSSILSEWVYVIVDIRPPTSFFLRLSGAETNVSHLLKLTQIHCPEYISNKLRNFKAGVYIGFPFTLSQEEL